MRARVCAPSCVCALVCVCARTRVCMWCVCARSCVCARARVCVCGVCMCMCLIVRTSSERNYILVRPESPECTIIIACGVLSDGGWFIAVGMSPGTGS